MISRKRSASATADRGHLRARRLDHRCKTRTGRRQGQVDLSQQRPETRRFLQLQLGARPVRPLDPGQQAVVAAADLHHHIRRRTQARGAHRQPVGGQRPQHHQAPSGFRHRDVHDLLEGEDAPPGLHTPVPVHQPFGEVPDAPDLAEAVRRGDNSQDIHSHLWQRSPVSVIRHTGRLSSRTPPRCRFRHSHIVTITRHGAHAGQMPKVMPRLEHLYRHGAGRALGPRVQALRQIMVQNYYRDAAGRLRWRTEEDGGLPPSLGGGRLSLRHLGPLRPPRADHPLEGVHRPSHRDLRDRGPQRDHRRGHHRGHHERCPSAAGHPQPPAAPWSAAGRAPRRRRLHLPGPP